MRLLKSLKQQIQKETKRLQIITKILTLFTNPIVITIYGPNEIPYGHPLYGKSLLRHGAYKRDLILSNRLTVRFIIFRFREILPIGSKHKSVTYSLLPFYISPYQRHINKTIDTVLEMFFFKHQSKFSIANELDIGIATVRRWISKFSAKADEINTGTEKMMIASKPGYRAVAYSTNNIFQLVRSIYQKVFQLTINKNILFEYGVLSWLNLNFQS
jgi:hypothetical protein